MRCSGFHTASGIMRTPRSRCRGSASGRLDPFTRRHPNGRNRRNLPLHRGFGEGRLTPEATFMVAGVNRRAGSTGDSGTAVRSGKAARALPVGFPSDNRAVPLGVISPRFPHFDGHQREPQRPGPRVPGPTPITKPRSRSSFSCGLVVAGGDVGRADLDDRFLRHIFAPASLQFSPEQVVVPKQVVIKIPAAKPTVYVRLNEYQPQVG